MIGKILKKGNEPKKVGNMADLDIDNQSVEIAVYLTFPKLEDGVSKRLESKLTIGSEVGDLILSADHGVSSRHCSLIVNARNIVSVIDHSSEAGTYINKKRLDPGKSYFLNENDKLKIGNILAKLEFMEVPALESVRAMEDDQTKEIDIASVSSELSKAQDSDEIQEKTEAEKSNGTITNLKNQFQSTQKPVEIEEKTDTLSNVELYEETAGEEINLDAIKALSPQEHAENLNNTDNQELESDQLKEDDKPSKKANGLSGGKRNSRKKISIDHRPAANAIFRIFAFGIDVLLTLSLVEVFYPFIEFKSFYDNGAKSIWEFGKNHLGELVHTQFVLMSKSLPLLDTVKSTLAQSPYTMSIASVLFMTIILRVVSSFIFGVSLGQTLVGMKSSGSFFLKRIIAPVREVLGVITFPFLIFDLPTLISKRSLKEVITRSRVECFNSSLSFFMVVISTVLSGLLYGISPLYKGLETQSSVLVQSREQAIKPWSYTKHYRSEQVGISYDYSQKSSALPSFEIISQDSKKILRPKILLLDVESGRSLEIQKVKTISMLDIYQDFVNLNILSQYYFPTIYGLVKDVSRENKNFKRMSKKSVALAEETKKILNGIFTLTVDNLSSFVIEQGPILSGHRDFREKFESIFNRPIEAIEVINIRTDEGILPAAMVSLGRGKDMSYSIVPLGITKPSVYVLNRKLTSPTVASIVGHLSFKLKNLENDPISLFIEQLVKNPKSIDPAYSQMVYERYFELSKIILKNEKYALVETVNKNVNKLIGVLDLYKVSNRKLYQNLSELSKALAENNLDFFGIRKVERI